MEDPGAKLVLTEDTVLFDTIFTTVGSVTKRFTVRNENENAVKVDIVPQGRHALLFASTWTVLPSGSNFNDASWQRQHFHFRGGRWTRTTRATLHHRGPHPAGTRMGTIRACCCWPPGQDAQLLFPGTGIVFKERSFPGSVGIAGVTRRAGYRSVKRSTGRNDKAPCHLRLWRGGFMLQAHHRPGRESLFQWRWRPVCTNTPDPGRRLGG